MSKCFCCGKEISENRLTCVPCEIKYGDASATTVEISQEEYQKLRHKEMLYDALENSNEEYN